MSKVKESLEANMDYIRSQLPDELKEHADVCMENCEVEQDNIELSKQQVVQCLPDELKDSVDANNLIPTKETAPTIDEQRALVLAALPDEFHADFEKNAANELAAG